MKLFNVFLLLPLVLCFDMKNFFRSSIIGTMLSFPVTLNTFADAFEQPDSTAGIVDQQGDVSASISLNKNNVYVYGEITARSCELLKNQLLEMDYNGRIFKMTYGIAPPPINLHIQSGGGSLMNAFYIVDLIENLETPVHTYVDGFAASAASLISVVGEKRFMTKNSAILIHQLSSEKKGKYQELDDDMKNMQQFMEKIKNIYLEKTELSLPRLDELLNHDLWLDATTCKRVGLVDEII